MDDSSHIRMINELANDMYSYVKRRTEQICEILRMMKE